MTRLVSVVLLCLFSAPAIAQIVLPWPGVHPTTETEQFKLYADNLKLGCVATTNTEQEQVRCIGLAQALVDVYSLMNFDEVSWILGTHQGTTNEYEELRKKARVREFVDLKRKFIHNFPRAAAFVENKRADDT